MKHVKFLETQSNYNKQITDEFIEDYIEILTQKRKYYHGPGNEKSRTDYGRFRTDGTTLENIFGILIGKCSFILKNTVLLKLHILRKSLTF